MAGYVQVSADVGNPSVLPFLPRLTDFGGDDASVGSCHGIGDEEGIATYYFLFVVGEFCSVPYFQYLPDEGRIDAFGKFQDASIAFHPIEEWVVFLSVEHFFQDFLRQFDIPNCSLMDDPGPEFRDLLQRVVRVAGRNQHVCVEQMQHFLVNTPQEQWLNVPGLDS